MSSAAEPLLNRAHRPADPFRGGIPIALVALAVTGIGFWRTFLSRLGEVDAAHMLHGFVMIAWLMLVMAQATLIRTGRYKIHRIVGWASSALFVLMMVTSWQMIALMLSGRTRLPFDLAKFFAYTDLIDMPLMIILYGGAILLRKDRYVHSRLVSSTTLSAIIPALARMFNRIWSGMDGLVFSMHPTYVFVLGVLAIAIWADWKQGRLRWPLPFAFAWFVFDYASLFPAMHWQWFDRLARAIAATA